jgi:hypothetical protein
MLLEKAHASSKRPAWCIERIMKTLHNEFDSEQLTYAREKAISYMARTSLIFKRLQNLTDETWEKMAEPARLRQRQVLKEFEEAAESWRQGPYGVIWNGGKLKREPTETELAEFQFRLSVQASTTSEPKS